MLCNLKLSNSLFGRAPSQEELTKPKPLERLDEFIANEEFRDRFARFINSKFNDIPGARREDEVAYNVVKHYILEDENPGLNYSLASTMFPDRTSTNAMKVLVTLVTIPGENVMLEMSRQESRSLQPIAFSTT